MVEGMDNKKNREGLPDMTLRRPVEFEFPFRGWFWKGRAVIEPGDEPDELQCRTAIVAVEEMVGGKRRAVSADEVKTCKLAHGPALDRAATRAASTAAFGPDASIRIGAAK